MQRLPVIVGFGGINAAGRASFHHSYRRMVHEALNDEELNPMFQGLASLMNLENDQDKQYMLDHTLIRKIEDDLFDVNDIKIHKKTTLKSEHDDKPLTFVTSQRQLPTNIPDNWTVEEIDGKQVKVTVNGEMEVMTHDSYKIAITSAGQLPSGFKASKFYNSANQPKGLQLAVFAASDALHSVGMDWNEILNHIQADQVSVYAGSAIGQFDNFGGKGLFQALYRGGRVTSKQLPLLLSQMPADFVNSYVINSAGTTGANIGACATFLYNLRQGVADIQSGKARVVIVGGADALVEPEIIEGFKAMGALSEDEQIAALDGTDTVDNRRASRPFAENAGFVIAEGAQFFILMDDELAVKLGATIYGSVPDVYVNADANKKSISSPGIGNYLTVAKCAALARNILGEDGVKHTFVQAHGTGTPQNRVTESHILNEVAKAFDIEKWPVAAIKSYVGHSLGSAGGDQLTATLGVWEYGYIPSINTIDKIADDVYDSNLEFCLDHRFAGDKGNEMKGAILNSKGFGGNNASGLILSPHVTTQMLENKYGKEAMQAHQQKNQAIKKAAQDYDQRAIKGEYDVIYHFGTSVMGGDDLAVTNKGIKLSEFKNEMLYNTENPYSDFCK